MLEGVELETSVFEAEEDVRTDVACDEEATELVEDGEVVDEGVLEGHNIGSRFNGSKQEGEEEGADDVLSTVVLPGGATVVEPGEDEVNELELTEPLFEALGVLERDVPDALKLPEPVDRAEEDVGLVLELTETMLLAEDDVDNAEVDNTELDTEDDADSTEVDDTEDDTDCVEIDDTELDAEDEIVDGVDGCGGLVELPKPEK